MGPLFFMPFLSLNSLEKSNFACIDLGSNALRAMIVQKSDNDIKILKSLRLPIRLGEDVFKNKVIGNIKAKQLLAIFVDLLYLFTEYNVTDVVAVATSAMREAKNSQKILNEIKKLTGINLKIISGKKEAQLIAESVKEFYSLKNKNALVMDIGGGSTELIILKNNTLKDMKSFKIGTVRILKNQHLDSNYKISIEKFIEKNKSKKQINLFVGTGGNLRRLGKIKNSLLKTSMFEISAKEISRVQSLLKSISKEEQILKFNLDENRSDVLIPALEITETVRTIISAKKILLPTVGLKEALILSKLENKKQKKKFIQQTLLEI